jgi:hypothetical protein
VVHSEKTSQQCSFWSSNQEREMLKSHKPPTRTARESNSQAPSCTKRILSYGFSQEGSRKETLRNKEKHMWPNWTSIASPVSKPILQYNQIDLSQSKPTIKQKTLAIGKKVEKSEKSYPFWLSEESMKKVLNDLSYGKSPSWWQDAKTGAPTWKIPKAHL